MTARRVGWLWAALAAFALLVATAPRTALAQAEPDVTARASAREVEVGESFTIELKALAEGGAATTDPELRAPREFAVSGPQISTQSFAQFGPGGSSVKTGIGATWQLVASKEGHFTIPAPSVLWNGKRLRAKAIPIDVVPSTGRSQKRPGRSPFLLPGGPNIPWPFDNRSQTDQLDEAEVDGVKELALDKSPDPELFLRAIADKTAVVVGEQVTISFYLYHRIDFELTDKREAALSDFLRVPLLKNPGTDPPQYAMAGGKRFVVRLLDRVAAFPLHAGDLSTGHQTARFQGRRLGSNVLRTSNDLVIHVTEPPTAGRPAGYTLGDVGKFSIAATIEPRAVEQGGTISVTLKVTGTGNLPQSFHVPERTGIEWFDPEKRESIEPQAGVVGGWRSFGYVVRIKESGAVDLGRVDLPYWDPSTKKYETATAELGVVDVKPSATAPTTSAAPGAASAEPAERDAFPALPAPRRALGTYAPPRSPIMEGGSAFWWLLATPPMLVVLWSAGVRVTAAARRRRASTKSSPTSLVARSLGEADDAETRGDAKAMAAAVERALYHAIEAATGLKGRGILLEDLTAELTAHGVRGALAERVRAALSLCERARFDPNAAAKALGVGDTGDAVGSLAGLARDLCRELSRAKSAPSDSRAEDAA